MFGLKSKAAKIIVRTAIYGTLFGTALGGTVYMLPNAQPEIRVVGLENLNNGNDEAETEEARFMSKLLSTVTTEGLSAKLGLTLSFADKLEEGDANKQDNRITLKTDDLFLFLTSREDGGMNVNLALNAVVDYNGYGVALGVNYTDDSLYVALGQRMKDANGSAIVTENTEEFDVKNALNVKYRVTVDHDIEDLMTTFGDILSNFVDTSNPSWLLSTLGGSKGEEEASETESEGFSYELVKDHDTESGNKIFDLTLNIPSFDTLTIKLVADSDFNLVSGTVEDFSFKGVTISDVSVSTKTVYNVQEKIESLKPADADSYAYLANVNGLVRDAYNIVLDKTFSVEVNGRLTNNFRKKEETNTVKNLSATVAWPESDGQDASAEGSSAENNAQEFIDFYANASVDLNKAFDVSATLGASYTDENEETYKKELSLDYLTYEGYDKATAEKGATPGNVMVSYNNLKFGMDHLAVDAMVAEIERDVEKASSSLDLSKLTSSIAFLSSDALNAIKAGHYWEIADCLNSVRALDNGGIYASLSLASFGFGEDSVARLTLESAEGKAPLTVSLEKIALGDDFLDLTVKLTSYNEEYARHYTVEELAEFNFIEGLPTITNQIVNLVDNPQVALSFNASIMDTDVANSGTIISGTTSFDVKAKSGSGKLDITQVGTKVTNASNKSVDKVHSVKIDVDPEEILLHYDSNQTKNGTDKGGLYGRIQTGSIGNVIDTAMGLVSSGEDRFSKFLSGAEVTATSSLLQSVMGGEYSALLTHDIIKDIVLDEAVPGGMENAKKVAKKSTIVLNSESLGLEKVNGVYKDLTVEIGYSSAGELQSLTLNNLYTGGKEISFFASMDSYSGIPDYLTYNSTNYMDLSSIDTLVNDVLTTAEQEDFHITGSITLKAIGITAADAEVATDIHVDGVQTYARVSITGLPLLGGVNNPYRSISISDSRNITVYYVPGVWGDSSQPGYVYASIYDTYKGGFLNLSTKHASYNYRYSESGLADNLGKILLCDWVGMSEDYYDSNFNADNDGDGTKDPFWIESLFSGKADAFTFTDHGNSGHQWDIKIDLASLAGTSILEDLDATITANANGTLTGIKASTAIISLVSAKVDITQSNTPISSSAKADYESYVNSHSSQSLRY